MACPVGGHGQAWRINCYRVRIGVLIDGIYIVGMQVRVVELRIKVITLDGYADRIEFEAFPGGDRVTTFGLLFKVRHHEALGGRNKRQKYQEGKPACAE